MAKRKVSNVRLEADPDGMNHERSEWAHAAIAAFIKKTGVGPEDALCDLLADLGHWCDRDGFNFARELRRAKDHYEAETCNGKGIVTGHQFDAIYRDLCTCGRDVVSTTLRGHGPNCPLYSYVDDYEDDTPAPPDIPTTHPMNPRPTGDPS
jgi:hypothetical protein